MLCGMWTCGADFPFTLAARGLEERTQHHHIIFSKTTIDRGKETLPAKFLLNSFLSKLAPRHIT
jgi:hypothetical protein